MTVKLLIVSSQLSPHGSRLPLGEMLGELIPLLGARGVQVEAILPLHSDVAADKHGLARRLTKLDLDVGEQRTECTLYEGRHGPHQARLWFIGCPPDAERAAPHARHDDDHVRFYLLAKAALSLARQSEHAPAAILAVGWQAGFVPLLARDDDFFARSKRVFALEDPRELGLFDAAGLEQLAIDRRHFTPDGLEFHGRASLLKAGVVYSDRVVLPSFSALEEVQQERYGAGLEGLYAACASKLVGILGGMDTANWDPASDHHIAAPFSAKDLSGKDACKSALQRDLGLRRQSNKAVLALLGPLTRTSQLDHLATVARELPHRKVQLAFVGSAGPEQLEIIEQLKRTLPERVAHFSEAPSEALLHQVLAGADGLIVTDRYTATGLDVLKGLRYGALPIGHPTGAARDVMVDFDVVGRTGNAFCSDDAALSLLAAVDRLLSTFDNKERWRTLQRAAMDTRFSWAMCADRWASTLEQLCTR